MNQILDYTPNKKSGGGSSNSDKIVRVFAVMLVIFALCLLGSGVYSIMKNKESEKQSEVKPTFAEITATQDGEQVKVSVKHDKVISKMIYSWNTSSERSVPGGNETSLDVTLDLPAGKNTLHVKVIDNDGVESSFEKEFTAENGLDILNPVIDIKVIDGEEERKLQITATDETKLDFITYRWNDEEETKVEVSDNDKEIVAEIDIMRGENDITIVAVDSSNNTTTETKSFIAKTKPEVVVELSADGSTLNITATHENGIEKVHYSLNGREYAGTFEDKPTIAEFTQALDVGYNRFILTVTSVDGTETFYDGECDYEPPAEEPPAEEGTEEPPVEENQDAGQEEQTEE